MRILFLTAALLLSPGSGAQAAQVDKSALADTSALAEFRSLIAVEPVKRTKKQKQRIRELWRERKDIKKGNDWYSVLNVGDSVLDFPGLIVGKTLSYDPEAKEYLLRELVHGRSEAEDTWDKMVVFSESGVVLRKERLKMNSR